MTNREAMNLISSNKTVFQYDAGMTEALDLAIKALNNRKSLCPVEFPTKDDPYPVCTYERWIEFARWVAKEVLDDYFDENSDSFAEIACRKLVKLGLVEDNDNVYKMKGEEE